MSATKTASALYDLVEVDFTVPSTVEEFDNQVGEAGACLAGGISDVIYRNTYPRLYKTASAELAKTHPKVQAEKDGKPQFTSPKTGEPKPVMEADMSHLERIWTEGVKNEDGTPDPEATVALQTQIAELLQSTAKSLPFYVEGRSGDGSGAGKVSQANLDAANGWLAAGDEAAITRRIGVIESKVPGYKVRAEEDGTYTAESLARGIAALNKQLLVEKAREAKAMLA